jgi:hypothetical protein
VLETLAVIRAEGQVPLPELIRAEAQPLPRGTSVIIITPSDDVRWVLAARQMERAGLRLVTVVMDSATFGGEQETKVLASQMAITGAHTYLVQCDVPLEEALSKPFAP